MLKLSKDPKYITELQEFQNQINRVLIQKNKQHAQNLLNDIIHQANLIDEGHASNNDGNIDPHTLRSNVVELTNLRVQLKNFLKGA